MTRADRVLLVALAVAVGIAAVAVNAIAAFGVSPEVAAMLRGR